MVVIPRRDEAIHHERHVKIICIGAGASGLCLAYKLQRSFRNFSLVIYEKNDGVSGTWLENRYPGCSCDNAAHNYTYTFEPKYDWSREYAGSAEIREYFEAFAAKHKLYSYIKLGHRVSAATWDEISGTWKVKVERLAAETSNETQTSFEDSCNILINAGGYLNNWTWPDVPGLEKFQGTLLHSASWDEQVKLTGKRVGLLGNGSSAIQILPAIQPDVEKLVNFIRSPTYVWSKEQKKFTAEEMKEWKNNPEKHLAMRKATEAYTSSLYSVYIRDSELQMKVKAGFTMRMKKALAGFPLEKDLIPDWAVGCRRLTPGPGYLEAIRKDNVELALGGVVSVNEHGCTNADGTSYELDVLICATGFNTSYTPRFPIIGKSNLNLQNEWDPSKRPESYLGIAVANFPNYLTFLGPQSPVTNGPLICGIEAAADHMLQLITRYQTEKIHSFAPSTAAVADFIAHTDSFMEKTVWTDNCDSWFKKHGKVVGLWPGSTLHYLEAMKDLRSDDWDFVYMGNRFDFLGNGYSQVEFDPTSDLGYYLDTEDNSPFASRGKRLEVASHSGTMPERKLHLLPGM